MPNKRAVVQTTISIDTVTIPISVYKTVDQFGLPGQLFHDECGGKVHQLRECENHPGEHDIVTFSGIPIDDQVVPIDSSLRSHLLDRHAGLEIVGVRPLKELPELIGTRFIPLETYEVTHQRTVGFASQSNDLLVTLFERMRIKKKYLLLTCPVAGMCRFAVLLPNGRLMALAYQEEIRETDELVGSVDRDASRIIDNLLSNDTTFPEMTLTPYFERIETWVKGIRRKAKIVANAKKQRQTVEVS